MKNHFLLNSIIISSFCFMQGCASDSVEESQSNIEKNPVITQAPVYVAPAPIIDSSKKNAKVVETIAPSSKPVEEKTVATDKSKSDRLSIAIKNQSDDEILSATTEVLTQNPKDVKALNALAMVYFKKGRMEAAEYLLKKAIAQSPQTSELYNNLALIKLTQNERREAVKAFRKGLEVNANDPIIGTNLGAVYIADKDFTKAELALEIPYKKGIKDLKVLNNYAIALAGVGKTSQAAELYDRLLKENPSQREVMLNYSILMINQQQKYKEGLDLINRLKFVGIPTEAKNVIKDLESRAKAGLK